MVPQITCTCGTNAGGSSDVVNNASGYSNAAALGAFSRGPVRYADGVVNLSTTDLESDGFGQVWGQTPSWTNANGYTGSGMNGNGWIVSQLPFLVSANAGATMVVISKSVN